MAKTASVTANKSPLKFDTFKITCFSSGVKVGLLFTGLDTAYVDSKTHQLCRNGILAQCWKSSFCCLAPLVFLSQKITNKIFSLFTLITLFTIFTLFTLFTLFALCGRHGICQIFPEIPEIFNFTRKKP